MSDRIATTTDGFWAARKKTPRSSFPAELEKIVAILWPDEDIRELWVPRIPGQTKNGGRIDDAVIAATEVVKYAVAHDIKIVASANLRKIRRAVNKLLSLRNYAHKQRLIAYEASEAARAAANGNGADHA